MRTNVRKTLVGDLYARSRPGLWDNFVELLSLMENGNRICLKAYPFDIEQFAEAIRSDDLWIVGSREFKTPEELLYQWSID